MSTATVLETGLLHGPKDDRAKEEPTGSNKRSGFAAGERVGKRSAKGRRGEQRHLFAAWEEIAERLRKARHLALLLDFDGTLVNLQTRPGEVRLRPSERRVLARLAHDPRIFVVFISGRTRADIRRRVAVAGARYLGLYGWDGENGRAPAIVRVRRRIEKAKTAARTGLGSFPGVWVEDKGLSFVVHFRGASRAVAHQVSRVVRSALRPFKPSLRMLPGKQSWEILPSMIRGKGAAVRALLARLPESTLPIYAGDDAADESAFRALRRGITVHVGRSPRTCARFRLRNPEEVSTFLEKLEGEVLCW
jgi:trehalose-phosphatase